MNRFVKRSMEKAERAPQGDSEQPLIALHKVCDSPAGISLTAQHPKDRHRPGHFGGGPFPIRRLPGLAGAVLMNAAPLSERFNFEGIVSLLRKAVNRKVKIFGKFVILHAKAVEKLPGAMV